MAFNIGDEIIVRANAEEMQDPLFQAIDRVRATISELYHTEYEPDVLRIEVTLENPVVIGPERITVVPGLYIDNIERIDSSSSPKKKSKKSEPKNESLIGRPYRSFMAFNESLSEPEWYYGLADCHGLDSFIKEPVLDVANDMDALFDLGLMPTDASNDPNKREYNKNIGMLKARAQANLQRWPVIYRAKLSRANVKFINDLLDMGDDENALKVVQHNSELVQIARGLGSNPERRWKAIPNPDLDPMNGGSTNSPDY